MAKIGLIDVDGHHYPNLALMRISSYHKSIGDTVEWLNAFEHYDRVYMSKVFSSAYSDDYEFVINADEIVCGGTGYGISLVSGREVYDKEKDGELPEYIEKMKPDYSIYPQYDFAIAMTSRGCPRGCGFCHVVPKEGRCSRMVAEVGDFYAGQKRIQVLDPNITACKDKRILFKQYKDTGALIELNQGLDIRLINDGDINDLNDMRLESIHFAWDNPSDNLYPQLKNFAEKFNRKMKNLSQVFVLTNYEKCSKEEHIERALERIYKIRELGYNPYLMIYDKPHCDRELKRLQRWCNNKFIFRACERYEDYKP